MTRSETAKLKTAMQEEASSSLRGTGTRGYPGLEVEVTRGFEYPYSPLNGCPRETERKISLSTRSYTDWELGGAF